MRLPPLSKFVTALVAGLLLTYCMFPSKVLAGSPTPSLPKWLVPLTAPAFLVAEFEAPLTRYGPGHRGVDYSVRDRQTITAPASGVVAYSGLVADKPVLTIRHTDGLISAFEPACSLLLVGSQVIAGQPIGSVCASLQYRSHCDPWLCLHFSVRRNGAYLSPRVFIGGLPGARLLQRAVKEK